MSTKRKLPQKLAQPRINQSAKLASKGALDESRTVVSGGANAQVLKPYVNGVKDVIGLSNESAGGAEEDEEEEGLAEEEEDEDEGGAGEEEQAGGKRNTPNGVDMAMEDADADADALIPQESGDNGEPSFGDLVRANADEPIDVAGAFEEEEASSRAHHRQSKQIQPRSGASLGTVLAQALRTNDVAWLESCLQTTTDVDSIRATIQRLDSPLAGILLQKLAERLHRKPGRAGTLMVWVQWTLVTHGGYLATQRDLIKKLSELNRVVDERAKGLPSLLSLKGKLDMLEAQMDLRKTMQNQRLRMDEDEDDRGIIYVEGQESDDEAPDAKPTRNGHLRDVDESSEISEDMPMVNGTIPDSADEEEGSSGDDLIDDEAEETDDDSGDEDEDEVDHDDHDLEEGESEDGEAPPPTKLQRLTGMFSKKR